MDAQQTRFMGREQVRKERETPLFPINPALKNVRDEDCPNCFLRFHNSLGLKIAAGVMMPGISSADLRLQSIVDNGMAT